MPLAFGSFALWGCPVCGVGPDRIWTTRRLTVDMGSGEAGSGDGDSGGDVDGGSDGGGEL